MPRVAPVTMASWLRSGWDYEWILPRVHLLLDFFSGYRKESLLAKASNGNLKTGRLSGAARFARWTDECVRPYASSLNSVGALAD